MLPHSSMSVLENRCKPPVPRALGAAAPLRIAAFSSVAPPCGVAKYHADLCRSLRGRATVDTFELSTERIVRNDIGRILRQRRAMADMARHARDYDASLVHFAPGLWNGGRFVENMLPVFLRHLGRPAVLVLHEWPDLPPADAQSGNWIAKVAKKAVLNAIARRDFAGADYGQWSRQGMFQHFEAIVVHSPLLAQRLLAAGIGQERIASPPYPVHRPTAGSLSPESIRERFQLCGRRVLTAFGFPDPRKGFDVAVRALAMLPPDVVLVLAGGCRGPSDEAAFEALTKLAMQLGIGCRVRITGYLDDTELTSLLSITTIAVAPFRSVTGSGSIGHFIGAGNPIVASDLHPIQRLVAEGAGIATTPADDAEALTAQLETLLANSGERAALAARNRLFSQAHGFDELAALVSVLLKQAIAANMHQRRQKTSRS